MSLAQQVCDKITGCAGVTCPKDAVLGKTDLEDAKCMLRYGPVTQGASRAHESWLKVEGGRGCLRDKYADCRRYHFVLL